MSDCVTLSRLADEALGRCRCMYSGFSVVAVLEACDGRTSIGVNIENASYGLTICAERAAVCSALSAGIEPPWRRILVFSPDGLAMPCGACRQVLAEFCGEDFEVVIRPPSGPLLHHSLGSLLPNAFKPGGAPPLS